jgi:hypothetical protein
VQSLIFFDHVAVVCQPEIIEFHKRFRLPYLFPHEFYTLRRSDMSASWHKRPCATTAPSRQAHPSPAFSAALAIPDLAALILSAYCSGIRVDFHPPAWVIAARSWVAPTRVECPLTLATYREGHPNPLRHPLEDYATLPEFSAPPI